MGTHSLSKNEREEFLIPVIPRFLPQLAALCDSEDSKMRPSLLSYHSRVRRTRSRKERP